jgi:hypothetical protein
MKKITCAILFLMAFTLQARVINPGDTTWVHTNQVNLDHFGDFDFNVTFPDGTKTYRKILMVFELGQYDCPGTPQYCHQWDYTVTLQLLTTDGPLEMGRFITPFATSGWPRFGPSWKQPYVFDVTDYYPLLQGNNDIRVHYSGYSWGFTGKVSFAFIEGTPKRNVIGIKKVFDVSETYGDAADPYNNHLPSLNETAPTGTQSAAMKFIVSGHGADNNGCCEFASHYYQVLLDGTQISQTDIWRDDCGVNDIYPQGGTWIYNRSNWCPGLIVNPDYHNLPNITDGTSYQLDVNFENYAVANPSGSYHSTAIVFYYGGFNKTLDAGLTDIVAPTTDPDHFRANPSSNVPIIKVQNTGSSSISSIDFNYGVVSGTSATHTWTGTLAPLEETTIELPALADITNMSIAGTPGPHEFEVDITGVNGQTDDDSTNNSLVSDFELAPVWPGDIRVKMKTNNLSSTGSFNANPADVSWEITDMAGNVVASRTNANHSTQYDDLVSLPAAGFYKLKLTSANCLGLYWWAIDAQYPIYEPGNFRVTTLSETNLPMNNYTYSGTPHDDWGCEYVQYFTVAAAGTAGVEDMVHNESIRVYPNPADDYFNIEVMGIAPPYDIQLVDITGKSVYQTIAEQQNIQIPTRQLSSGVYMLVFTDGENQKRVEKVVIAR